MKYRGSERTVSAAVVAYCDDMEVPAFDDEAIAMRHRTHLEVVERVRPRTLRVAIAFGAILAVLLVARNFQTVDAAVVRMLQAFSVASGGTRPMTIAVVDLERARDDVSFEVVAPPSLSYAPIVTVDEVYPGTSRADARIIFEIRGKAPGHEITIIEGRAAEQFSPTLLLVRGSAGAGAALPSPPPLAPPASSGLHTHMLLRASSDARPFTPSEWIVHGTRISVLSPPGFLTDERMRVIRRAMSR